MVENLVQVSFKLLLSAFGISNSLLELEGSQAICTELVLLNYILIIVRQLR